MDPRFLGRLLRTSSLPRPRIAAALRRLKNRYGPAGPDWSELDRDPSLSPLVDELRFAALLGQLTGNHLPLVRELQRRRQRGELQHARELFRIDWHELVAGRAGGRRVGTPPGIPGRTAAERASHYAREVAGRLHALFPTAAVAHALTLDDATQDHALVRFFDDNPGFDIHRTPVDAVTGRASMWAGIAESERPAVLEKLRGLQRLSRLTAGLHSQAATMHRLLEAGLDSAHAIAGIDEQGFCRRLAPAPLTTADARVVHARALRQVAAAMALFTRCNPMHDRVQLAAIGQAPSAAGGLAAAADASPPPLLGGGVPFGGGSGGGGPRMPDWERLFGPLNRARGDQSVLSPSAYLVDLLHMLQALELEPATGAPGTPPPTALDLLRRRRPDITRIELGQANTETLLPYIDLVNEVLEAAVFPSEFRISEGVAAQRAELEARTIGAALQAGFAGAGFRLSANAQLEYLPNDYRWLLLDDKYQHLIEIGEDAEQHEQLTVTVSQTRPHQTLGCAADLRANPEHADMDAYGVLKRAVYPWAVPFDLPAEEARVYLQHLGLPRHALMELFLDTGAEGPGGPKRAAALAAEAFGLTEGEREVLAGKARCTAPELWGFAADEEGTWVRALARVPLFLARTGLDHGELAELLATRYVNPKGEIRLRQAVRETPEARITQTPGNVDDATIDKLDADALVRVLRLVRLQRKTGWSLRELDRVLAALRGAPERQGPFDDALLARVWAAARLQRQLGLPLDELLVWFAGIDTAPGPDGSASSYDRLFHDQSLQGGVIAAFALNGARDALRQALELDAAAKAALGGALQVSARELERLVEAVLGDGAKQLGLDALSRLQRAASMRRTLRLSLDDFLSLRAWAGDEDPTLPDAKDPTRAAVAFVATAQRVEASGFSIEELDYLLRHRIRPQSAAVPDDAAVGRLLGELRDGLRRIQDDHRLPETDDERALAELLRRKLGQLNWDDTLHVQPVLAALVAGSAPPPTLRTLDPRRDTSLPPATEGTMAGTPHEPAADRVLMPDPQSALRDLPDATARLRCVLSHLLPHTRRLDGELLVARHFGEALGLEVAVARQLVLRPLAVRSRSVADALLDEAFVNDAGVAARSASPEPSAACHWMHKMALLVQRLRIQPDELPWILDADRPAGLLDLDTLPLSEATAPASRLQGLLGLADLFAARDRIGKPAIEGLRAARGGGGSQQQAAALSAALGWSEADVQRLVLDAGLLNEWSSAALRLCAARVEVLRKLDVPAATAQAWAQADVTPAVAAAIKQAAKARHDQASWLESAGPLRDTLREKQRATLVAYLVATHQFADAYALYQHFLIDVEMGARTMTSRIKLAIGAVQLFVQRLLMNLEDHRIPGPQASACKAQWQALKNFRVWEANRKVFLYPENWIEPDLRKDKTALFREFESELQQGETSLPAAERALHAYLERLDAMARLEICAIAHDPAAGADTLHLFARTRSVPRSHHYRRREKDLWTGWEPLEAGVDGDHLIPVVLDHRLYLFWPEFTAQTAAVVRTASRRKLTAPGGSTLQAWEYWEMRLAFSELRQGSWSPKKILDGRLVMDLPAGATLDRGEILLASDTAPAPLDKEERRLRVAPAGFTFRADVDDTSVTLRCLRIEPGHVCTDQGGLRFSTDERVEISSGLGPVDVAPAVQAFHHEGMALVPDVPGAALALPGRPPLLQRTPRRRVPGALKEPLHAARGVRVICAPQAPAPDRAMVFAYQDDDRSFLVTVDAAGSPRLENLYHPAAGDFLRQVQRGGIGALLQRAQQERRRETVLFRLRSDEADFFDGNRVEEVLRNFVSAQHLAVLIDRGWTKPDTLELTTQQRGRAWQVKTPQFSCNVRAEDGSLIVEQDVLQQYGAPAAGGPALPEGAVDFSIDGAYSAYNWELFFHVPLLLADRLGKDRRFEEAQTWFHHVFDPTDLSAEAAPQRFWKFARFFEESKNVRPPVVELLELASFTGADDSVFGRKKLELAQQVAQWQASPFDPHAIARWRVSAYQKTVVMKYLDNLVAWGDQLFRQDTIESINEATQLYVLAGEILGKRPLIAPADGEAASLGFDGLQQHAGACADPFIRLEELVPLPPRPQAGTTTTFPAATLRQYFSVPANDKLLGYWDLVADRLFKIRHSQNIEGTERQLALFEPPIEPGLLVRAAAGGVDIAAALRDISVPLPHYRFRVMLDRALAFCGDVQALGAQFLAALEKRDAEGLEQLRVRQLSFELQRQIGQKAIEEAQQQVADLEEARALVAQQITTIEGEIAEWRGGKGIGSLAEGLFSGAKTAIEAGKAAKSVSFHRRDDYVKGRTAAETSATGVVAKATPHGPRSISTLMLAHSMYSAASTATSFPTVITGGAGVASPVALVVTGGGQVKSVWENLGKAFEAAGKVAELVGEIKKAYEALQQKIKDAEARRDEAKAGDKRLLKQLAAAQVRVEIAQLRKKSVEKAAENAEQVEAYMRSRFTNLELHGWRVSQLSTLYFQTYQMAYDLAKRAERAFEHEMGDPTTATGLVRFGQWDSLRKGLLAGEQLHFDLRRLEKAYLDQNRRCHEITRHVSLKSELPEALAALAAGGSCSFELPESLFDRDYPGHYMRRIRCVRLSVTFADGSRPANVNGTLTLRASSVRMRVTGAAYPRKTPNEPDARFRDELGALQSIVTSSGRDDSGLFELDPGDPRYLPFEGAGAISSWQLELPKTQPAAAAARLDDVVLHLSYTARDGGAALKAAALKELAAAPREARTASH